MKKPNRITADIEADNWNQLVLRNFCMILGPFDPSAPPFIHRVATLLIGEFIGGTF